MLKNLIVLNILSKLWEGNLSNFLKSPLGFLCLLEETLPEGLLLIRCHDEDGVPEMLTAVTQKNKGRGAMG